MTATKPKSNSQQCSSPSQNDSLKRANSNGAIAKRTRGPINKRACQRCRQGKIKCDGDAELGKACSNCDPQSCKFDNSPRKNKQVELLKQRMAALESQLVNIVNDVNEKMTMKELEADIMYQLWDLKELFNGSEVSTKLMNVVRQGKLTKQILVFTRELLQRVSGDHEKIPDIIESLQRIVDCAELKDPTVLSNIPPVEQYRNVNGEYEVIEPSYETSVLLPDSQVLVTDNSANLSSTYDVISCLNNHHSSSDDDGSETLSGEYGSGSPPTPNEQHSLDGDSEPYHHNSSSSSSQVSTSPISGFYYNATNAYYPSEYIDYNGPYYYEATNTTSPTDGFLA